MICDLQMVGQVLHLLVAFWHWFALSLVSVSILRLFLLMLRLFSMRSLSSVPVGFFFFQAEDGIRDTSVLEFRRVLFRSRTDCTFTPPDRCCCPASQGVMARPAQTFTAASLSLVPPFHVEGP